MRISEYDIAAKAHGEEVPRSTIQRPAAHHIQPLDGVRGLAILLVLAGHLFGSTTRSSNHWAQIVLSLRGLTWVGVNLFFALSGFLITAILYDTLESPHYFKSFFARRLLRTFPLYYGVLFLLLALTPFLHLHWDGTAIVFLTYTQNLPFTNNPSGPAPWAVLRQFWSLAVEEQFYLVWPFLLFWLRGWKKIMLAAVTGSAIALLLRTLLALTGGQPQNHATPFCMDALLVGGTLALLVRSCYRDVVLRHGWVVFLASCIFIVPPALRRNDFYWESSFYLTTIGLTIVNLGAAGFIAAALRPDSTTGRLFSAAWLRFFGKYSYGLYVFHYSISYVATDKLRPIFMAHGLGKNLTTLVTGFVALGLSVAVSVASYQFYEVHFLRLKRFFKYDSVAPTREQIPALGK